MRVRINILQKNLPKVFKLRKLDSLKEIINYNHLNCK